VKSPLKIESFTTIRRASKLPYRSISYGCTKSNAASFKTCRVSTKLRKKRRRKTISFRKTSRKQGLSSSRMWRIGASAWKTKIWWIPKERKEKMPGLSSEWTSLSMSKNQHQPKMLTTHSSLIFDNSDLLNAFQNLFLSLALSFNFITVSTMKF